MESKPVVDLCLNVFNMRHYLLLLLLLAGSLLLNAQVKNPADVYLGPVVTTGAFYQQQTLEANESANKGGFLVGVGPQLMVLKGKFDFTFGLPFSYFRWNGGTKRNSDIGPDRGQYTYPPKLGNALCMMAQFGFSGTLQSGSVPIALGVEIDLPISFWSLYRTQYLDYDGSKYYITETPYRPFVPIDFMFQVFAEPRIPLAGGRCWLGLRFATGVSLFSSGNLLPSFYGTFSPVVRFPIGNTKKKLTPR
jgi:hypothetical protein